MTRVLIIDGNPDSRAALENRLTESNQLEKVISCGSLDEATSLVAMHDIMVVLIEAGQASNSAALQQLHVKRPGLGLVLIQDDAGQVDPSALRRLGAHAQTSRMASPMEFVTCIAKALVVRLRPGKALLERFFPGGK